MQRAITADLLIDGKGDIIKDAVVLISKDRIQQVGASEEVDIPDGVEVLHTRVLMPGMMDAHTHFLGTKTLNFGLWMQDTDAMRAMRATKEVHDMLLSGYTAARDVGSALSLSLKRIINEGTILGPRIFAAHRALSQTAGHGDVHSFPIESVRHQDGWIARLVDGVDEARKATRETLRMGADLIKVFATGGVMSELDHPHQVQFTMEELLAIIQEARRYGVFVSAHAHGVGGIEQAVKAGVNTVEHAMYLNQKPELIELMKEKNVILVPTLIIVKLIVERGEELGFPGYAIEKAKEGFENHVESIKMAVDAELPIAAGSDFLGPPLSPYGFGNARELELLHNVGLKPMDVIRAATGLAAATAGPRSKNVGTIEPGKFADFLFLDKNPLDDVTLLQSRENIKVVIKGGEVVVDRRN